MNDSAGFYRNSLVFTVIRNVYRWMCCKSVSINSMCGKHHIFTAVIGFIINMRRHDFLKYFAANNSYEHIALCREYARTWPESARCCIHQADSDSVLAYHEEIIRKRTADVCVALQFLRSKTRLETISTPMKWWMVPMSTDRETNIVKNHIPIKSLEAVDVNCLWLSDELVVWI